MGKLPSVPRTSRPILPPISASRAALPRQFNGAEGLPPGIEQLLERLFVNRGDTQQVPTYVVGPDGSEIPRENMDMPTDRHTLMRALAFHHDPAVREVFRDAWSNAPIETQDRLLQELASGMPSNPNGLETRGWSPEAGEIYDFLETGNLSPDRLNAISQEWDAGGKATEWDDMTPAAADILNELEVSPSNHMDEMSYEGVPLGLGPEERAPRAQPVPGSVRGAIQDKLIQNPSDIQERPALRTEPGSISTEMDTDITMGPDGPRAVVEPVRTSEGRGRFDRGTAAAIKAASAGRRVPQIDPFHAELSVKEGGEQRQLAEALVRLADGDMGAADAVWQIVKHPKNPAQSPFAPGSGVDSVEQLVDLAVAGPRAPQNLGEFSPAAMLPTGPALEEFKARLADGFRQRYDSSGVRQMTMEQSLDEAMPWFGKEDPFNLGGPGATLPWESQPRKMLPSEQINRFSGGGRRDPFGDTRMPKVSATPTGTELGRAPLKDPETGDAVWVPIRSESQPEYLSFIRNQIMQQESSPARIAAIDMLWPEDGPPPAGFFERFYGSEGAPQVSMVPPPGSRSPEQQAQFDAIEQRKAAERWEQGKQVMADDKAELERARAEAGGAEKPPGYVRRPTGDIVKSRFGMADKRVDEAQAKAIATLQNPKASAKQVSKAVEHLESMRSQFEDAKGLGDEFASQYKTKYLDPLEAAYQGYTDRIGGKPPKEAPAAAPKAAKEEAPPAPAPEAAAPPEPKKKGGKKTKQADPAPPKEAPVPDVQNVQDNLDAASTDLGPDPDAPPPLPGFGESPVPPGADYKPPPKVDENAPPPLEGFGDDVPPGSFVDAGMPEGPRKKAPETAKDKKVGEESKAPKKDDSSTNTPENGIRSMLKRAVINRYTIPVGIGATVAYKMMSGDRGGYLPYQPEEGEEEGVPMSAGPAGGGGTMRPEDYLRSIHGRVPVDNRPRQTLERWY